MTGRPQARLRSGRARLSRSADFDRVFRRGRSLASRELVLHVFPRDDGGATRLGLSVSRKVGGAVQRNRVKRLLREAFAQECDALPPGTDAVIVARQDAWRLAEREGLSGVRTAVADLIGRTRASAAATGGADEVADASGVADGPGAADTVETAETLAEGSRA